MAIKQGKLFACSYCGMTYTSDDKADACRNKHNIIYLPISSDDLIRLIFFVYQKNDDLITPSLMRTLNKYLKGNDNDYMSSMFEGDREQSEEVSSS